MADDVRRTSTTIAPATAVQSVTAMEHVAKPSIEGIIDRAVQAGRTGAELKELLDVYERFQTNQAEQEFYKAFAAFQADCPAIPKSREAKIASRTGAGFSYRYASLDEIDTVVIPVLAVHGLSRSFGDAVIGADSLTVACRLSHIGGHARESSFTVPIGTSAGMSEQQKYGSAATYAKRQAFVNVAGLKVTDLDDDGAGTPIEPITTEQCNQLEDAIVELKADRVRFLAFLGVENLAELTSDRFEPAMARLSEGLARKRQQEASRP